MSHVALLIGSFSVYYLVNCVTFDFSVGIGNKNANARHTKTKKMLAITLHSAIK